MPNYVADGLIPLKDMSDLKYYTVKIQPFNGQTFSASGTRDIIFKLPREAMLVGSKSQFYFQAQVGGSNAAFLSDVHSVFDNMKVEVGNTEIINEQEYGWWKSLETVAKATSTDLTSASTSIMNIPATGIQAGYKKFAVPLASKWDSSTFFSQVLPTYKMDTVTLTYTINNTLSEFTVAQSAATSVDVKNCELELVFVDSPRLRAAFDKDIVREITTTYHHYSLLPNGSTALSINIPAAVQNLRGLALLQRDKTCATSANFRYGQTNQYQKYTRAFVTNALSKFSVTIDGIQYPKGKEVDGTDGVELVTNLSKFWQSQDNILGAWFDADTFLSSNSKGYYTLNFAGSDVKDGVSGMSLLSKAGNIIVNATLTAAQDTDCDTFITYSKFIAIKKDGSVAVTK
jgi:hypothetical protein